LKPPDLFFFLNGSRAMQAIRIPDEHWGKVWRTLVAAGPLTCVGPPPIYVMSDRQIRLLRRKKLPFEIVPLPDGRKALGESGVRESSN
jgi:hypothetical protein